MTPSKPASHYMWWGVALAVSSLAAYFAVALTVGFTGPAASWVAYGETPRSGPVAQPLSFWSDLGFIFAGLAGLRLLDGPRGPGWMQRPSVYSVGLGLIIVWMGPASMVEHGTLLSNWGWLDATAIHWFGLWVLGYFAVRWLGLAAHTRAFVVAELVVWAVLGAYTYHYQDMRQKVTMILLGAVIVAVFPSLVVLRFRRIAWAWFAGVLAAFGIATVFLVGGAQGHWAAPWGHAAWHLGSALAMYLTIHLLRAEQRASD